MQASLAKLQSHKYNIYKHDMKKLIFSLFTSIALVPIANSEVAPDSIEKKAADQRRTENLKLMQGLAGFKSKQITSSPDTVSDCEAGKYISEKIDYPIQSIKNREFGKVQLELILNKSGCVTSARILQSSNFEDLDNAALTGILRMKFAARYNSIDNYISKFSYNFKIDENEMQCITSYKQKNSEIFKNLTFLDAHTLSVEYCKFQQIKNLQPTTEASPNQSKSTLDIIKSIVGGERQPPTNTSSQTNDFSNPLNINPPANYAEKIVRRIRPNITYPGDLPSGVPSCEVEIKVKPDGEIYSRKILKSSGYQLWDAAIIRAIDRTERLPLDTDGKAPSVLIINFKP